MQQDAIFRFPWGSPDKPRTDRALREALHAKFGATIEADEPDSQDEPPPDDIEYEVAIPASFAESRHAKTDAPLPPAQDGHFTGTFWFRADEDAGATLVLSWPTNAHVWAIMFEIVESVAASLGGWRENTAAKPPRTHSNVHPPIVDDEDADDDESEEMFPSWEALRGWVKDAYSLEDDRGDTFSVTMTWSATPRKQVVTLTRTLDGDDAWLTFRSGVCRVHAIPADKALRINGNLTFARFVPAKDRYELTYSIPIDGLTVGRFTSLLEKIAELADDLENDLTRGGDEF